MANQRFVENPWHDKKESRARVPDDLWTAKRALVRADKVQSSLAPKYTGPYHVLHRWRKCFRVQLDNKTDTVSIDRLRPFYEDEALRSASNETVNSSVERGSSVVECRTRNRVSPGSNPPLLPFRRLDIFVLSTVVPVDSAV